ncbi:MAG: hypothetical protein ACTSU9_15215 [Promethearchaeota archaeon]
MEFNGLSCTRVALDAGHEQEHHGIHGARFHVLPGKTKQLICDSILDLYVIADSDGV